MTKTIHKIILSLITISISLTFLSITSYAENHLYGNIIETGITTGGLGPVYFGAKICDSDGNETVYYFAETVTINDETYYTNSYASENNIYDLQQIISVGTSVEFVVIDDKISLLNYGTPIYKFMLMKLPSKKVIANISIINAQKDVVSYIAIYKNKSLVSVTPVKFSLSDTSKNKEIILNNIDKNDVDDAKLFIWDKNLVPICTPIQANINE